jgi:hypothetical protein
MPQVPEEVPSSVGQQPSQKEPTNCAELAAAHLCQTEAQIKANLWMLTALVENTNISEAFRIGMQADVLHLAELFIKETKHDADSNGNTQPV